MTIRHRIAINTLVVAAALSAISAASVVGIRSIRRTVTELTKRSTPHQVKALQLQRALQLHATNLLRVSSAAELDEWQRASAPTVQSLGLVRKACDDLANLGGGVAEDLRPISQTTESITKVTRERIEAAQDAAKSAAAIQVHIEAAQDSLKGLDSAGKRLQQAAAKAMEGDLSKFIESTRKSANLAAIWDGLRELSIGLLRIPALADKRSVATARDRFGACVKGTVQTLKTTPGLERIAADLVPRLANLGERVTSTRGLAALQLQRIEDEDDNLKDRIETIAKESSYELAYLMPTIEREATSGQKDLAQSTANMSAAVDSLSATNTVLSLSSSLSLLGASIGNAVSESVGTRSLAEFDRRVQGLSEKFDQARGTAGKLKGLLSSPRYAKERALLESSVAQLDGVKTDFLQTGGAADRVRLALTSSQKLDDLNAKMHTIVAGQLKKSEAEVANAGQEQEKAVLRAHSAAASTMAMVLGVAGGAALVALLIGLWIGRSIVDPVSRTAAMIIDIGKGSGDLTRRLEPRGSGEVASLANGFNEMLGKLQRTIAAVAGKVDRLVASAADLTSTADKISGRAKSQADRTEQLAASADEMAAAVLHVSRSATDAAAYAEETKKLAANGSSVVMRSIDGIKDVARSITQVAGEIEALAASSAKVGEIAAVIQDIADQTNLLSLNAAIEAARAGEQGRGFSVVAESVRLLAERTGEATLDIARTVATIQRDTSKSAAAMRNALSGVEGLVDTTNTAAGALQQIVERVERKTEIVRSMATAASQQTATVDAMVSSIKHLSGETAELASATFQIAAASEALDRVAADLEGQVRQFKYD